MMDIYEALDELQKRALRDPEVCSLLMETRKSTSPVDAFCQTCRELGYEIYAMDLIQAGEDFYASMKRSTNGGGENSPMLDGEDDFYEMFFSALENNKKV